jgi:hypothetical protein
MEKSKQVTGELFYTEEDKNKLKEIESDISLAKSKLTQVLNDDLGVSCYLNSSENSLIAIDFSNSYNTLPFYVDLLRRLYDKKTNLFKEMFEKHGYSVVSDKKEEAKLAVTRKAEINMENQEIKIGDRVKLKGDSNSPEMTVTRDLRAEAQVQKGTIGKGVQEETKYSGTDNNDPYAIVECNYFIADPRNENYKELRQHRFHKDALQKLIPVQPSNKQKPTIESDIKAGDVVEMDDTKERFYVEELQTHGVKLVKVACYKLAAGNIYLTNYENMPFKKVERLNKQ